MSADMAGGARLDVPRLRQVCNELSSQARATCRPCEARGR
jgi:hypothetical protein